MSRNGLLPGRITAGLRALAADRTGAPVVEFAMVLPVLLTAYLGSFVVLDAISCSRKVSVAANQVTDITSRYMSVTSGDLDTIMAATTQGPTCTLAWPMPPFMARDGPNSLPTLAPAPAPTFPETGRWRLAASQAA